MGHQTFDEDTTRQRQFLWGYPPPDRPHGAEMSLKFEQIGCATLYVGDAREILPMLGDKAAVVVTDPVWPNCPKGVIPGSEHPWALWSETMRHLPEAVHRLVVTLRTDSDPRLLAAVPERLKFFRNIQLSYARPSFRNRILGSDEYAYWYGSVVARSDRRIVIPGRGPTAQPTQRRPGDHPCARAQVHLDWLIDRATDVGGHCDRPVFRLWDDRCSLCAPWSPLHRHRDRTSLSRACMPPHRSRNAAGGSLRPSCFAPPARIAESIRVNRTDRWGHFTPPANLHQLDGRDPESA
jgi:hypothetical protein